MNNYDDIINLPRHKSKKRIPMNIKDRAGQFSAFAALKGYEEAIKETARLTEKRVELDEYMKENLNQKLQFLMESPDQSLLKVKVTYFQSDQKKEGGQYIEVLANFKKINIDNKQVYLYNNQEEFIISIDEIVEIVILG